MTELGVTLKGRNHKSGATPRDNSLTRLRAKGAKANLNHDKHYSCVQQVSISQEFPPDFTTVSLMEWNSVLPPT